MLSIMRINTLHFVVMKHLFTQLKHDDLVHLVYDAAHNMASRATRWTEINSKNSARNARRKGRALGDVPAVRGGASWHPRAPRGRPA